MAGMQIDTDTVGSSGNSLTSAGWALATDSDLTMGACGSGRVSVAADDWAMWAKTTLLLLQGQATTAGQNATAAANAIAAQDQELAASTPTP